MSNEYPKMLYMQPGSIQMQDGLYGAIIINNKDEEKEALKSGWFLTMAAAKAAKEKAAVWKAPKN